MKRILFISFFIIPALLSAEGNVDSLFVAAGESYSEGNFENALALYEQVAEHGFEAPDLYFNMGNAAFRSNKLGYAVLYYHKALKLDPQHEKASRNLSYVSRYREDQLERVPEFFIKSWGRDLTGLFSVQVWSYLAIILFGFMLIAVVIYIFASRLAMKKAGFFSGLIILAMFIISLSAARYRHKEIVDPDQLVIVSPSVVVKSSPSLTGTDLFILHEGTEATLTDHLGNWSEIRISDGRIGWIPAEAFEVI